MGQQAFVIDIGGDDEHSADLADDGGLEGRRIEVVIQRAVGGFVELFGIERIVGGNDKDQGQSAQAGGFWRSRRQRSKKL